VGKIPYLFRRNNVYYFRIRIPIELQEPLQAKAIVRSLKTENRHEATPLALQLAANFAAALYDLKSGRSNQISMSSLIAQVPEQRAITTITFTQPTPIQPKSPLLSVVVADFLQRYDPKNKATLTKLKSTLPIFIELVGDKPIANILQADVNHYFDQVQNEAADGVSKSIKTNSSHRIVPIHSKLIALGFLDYVERIKGQNDKHLFPAWKPNHGKASGLNWMLKLCYAYIFKKNYSKVVR
jgi:hypothetical protein